MLRQAIKDHLVDQCPSFTGGFFQPQIANNLTPKPFGVIRIGPAEAFSRQGITKTVQVFVHCDRDDYDTLDDLTYEVVDALDDVMVPDGAGFHKPKHTGTTADAHDDDRETIFKITEFEVMIAR